MSIKAKIINGLCLFNLQSFGGLESFFRCTNIEGSQIFYAEV